MANVKEKKTKAKKTFPVKNTRKKINVRIEGKKIIKSVPAAPDINKKKEIVQQEIFKAEQKTEKSYGSYAESRLAYQSDEPQIERTKKIIMWCGVTFFMILIGSIWIYILSDGIKEDAKANSAGSTSELKDNLTKSMQEFKDSLEAFKELKNSMASTSSGSLENSVLGDNKPSAQPIINASTTATSTHGFIQASLPRAASIGTSTLADNNNEKDYIAELKKKLGELEKKLQEIK